MTINRSMLAPVLRSETQARLLAALLLRTGREASLADLARETQTDAGNLHAEVERLVKAGILSDRRIGRTRLIRAADSPLAEPLARLLMVGYGPKIAVSEALRGIPKIARVFIAGSWAARYQGVAGEFPHDIDVVVVGSPDRDEVAEAVEQAVSTVTGQHAQVIFRSEDAWARAADSFTKTVKSSPLVEVELSGDAH
jgi:hypothetical protein